MSGSNPAAVMEGASQAQPDAPPSRMQALDAVRALAILLVMGHHAAYRFAGSKEDALAGLLRNVGWIGVDIFFALSGFLIVRILLRDAAAGDLRGFFRRRFYRIVPIFAVALVVFAVAALVTGKEAALLPRLWIPALFLNGWMIPVFGVDGVPYVLAWSLSVEEFAYLALAVCALWGRRGLSVGVLAFLAIALCVRWGVLATGAFATDALYYFVPARLDAVAFGGLGALGAYGVAATRALTRWVAGLTTTLLIVCFQWAGGVSGVLLPAVGYGTFGMACALWVTSLAVPGTHHRSRVVRLLAPLGKVSYFMYLFELFVMEAVRLLSIRFGIELRFWPAMAVSVLACYALAQLSWRYFEYPLIARSHAARA